MDWNFSWSMSCRLGLRFQVKYVRFAWKMSYIFKATGIMSCFINGSLFTQVLPLCGCWTFLKANESLGFRTWGGGLLTCALDAGGPFHEVFCTGSAFTCTGPICFAVAIVGARVEGVVVLKGDVDSRIVGIVLESHWLCTASCCFHMSPNIWKTLDVPFNVPFTVLYLFLCPLILLKWGTFSSFTMMSLG